MVCPNCGRENVEGSTFCAGCGTKLEASDASTNQNDQQNPNVNMNQNPNNSYENQSGNTYQNNIYGNQNVITPNSNGVQEKNIALCIILSIITCGIYGLYWIYCLNEDAHKLAGDTNYTNGGLVIVFGIITCGIYMLYWMYKMGETLDKACQMRGRAQGSNGIVYLLLSFFGLGIIAYALMQNEINNCVR